MNTTPIMDDVDALRAEVERLRAQSKLMTRCLQSCERVFAAWELDADPDGILSRGESADKDAAINMQEHIKQALEGSEV